MKQKPPCNQWRHKTRMNIYILFLRLRTSSNVKSTLANLTWIDVSVCVCLPNGGFGGVSCFVFDFIAGQMTLKMFYLEQQSYKQILCNTCRGNKSKVCFKIIVHRINPCTLRHNDQKYTNFIQETILVAQVNFHMKVKNTQLPYYVFVSV